MYYVYYIKGVKVGCTKNPVKRIEEQQGYKDFEILFQTNDKLKASNAERYYQKLLGYKVDAPYINNKTKENMKIKTTNHTTTFKVKPSELTLDFLLSLGMIEVAGEIVEITQDLALWILENLQQSQFRKDEKFIYNNSLINASRYVIEKSNDPDIFSKIRDWAKERGLYDKGNSKTQYVKLQEEAGELAKALLNEDRGEVIDAIGDIVVVLTNLAYLEGLKIEDCINSAYNVIKDRTGKMQNGTFIRNK